MTALEILDTLTEAYGTPPWWSEDPYEVMVQAVLVQNTSWAGVKKVSATEPALKRPQEVLNMELPELEQRIRPCGFAKAKAQTIRRLTEWFSGYGFDACRVSEKDADALRKELLSLKGIGSETADVLMVYAFRKPRFIVDAYTRRFLKRLGFRFRDDTAVREFFGAGLPGDHEICGRCHWLILDHGIAHCKKTPRCGGCPFGDTCEKNGVNG